MEALVTNFIDWIASLRGSDVAVLAASAAATFTAYQAVLLRKHNRLSVKPHLCTWTHDDDSDKMYKIYFLLSNNGLGPAIIKSFKVYFDGERLGDHSNSKQLKSAINEKVQSQKEVLRHTVSVLGNDSAFPVGEKKTCVFHTSTHVYGL